MAEREKEPLVPKGVPTPRRRKPLRKKLAVGGSLVAGAGVAMVLVSSTTTRCMGSTRSARLMWEARQAQTERELADGAAADTAPAADSAGGETPRE